jgi:sulfate transport system ATP-binding protein
MAIVLEELSKHYGGIPVVHRLSLSIAQGELFVLLGPSGSGKSTLLRMIAGLTEADAGRIELQGVDVTDLPPQRRDVGFVFQHYALFRHLTVADNVEFPLRIRGAGRTERTRRRDELLELVGLGGLANRLPGQLSGGQQQRVALARALAHRPRVLLLDEPFGALDARIRAELRVALRAVQRELGVTTVFVTHDQEEAFELADRLAVMHLGRLLEAAPPEELYLRPRTEFVASFLGTANLLVGEATARGVRVGDRELALATAPTAEAPNRERVQVLFRPEDLALEATPEALGCPTLGKATVESRSFVGPVERLRLRLEMPGVRAIAPPVPFGADTILVEASRSQHHTRRLPLLPGSEVWVGIRRLHALTHPGLALLAATHTVDQRDAALELAGDLARLAQARLTVLACGPAAAHGEEAAQPARERLPGAGNRVDWRADSRALDLAVADDVARHAVDLVILGGPATTAASHVGAALGAGEANVLWVPTGGESRGSGSPVAATTPVNALICVAVGEPGKEDVGFAGRLLRHLGARATILTVLAPAEEAERRPLAERFLAASVRTLGRYGIQSTPHIAVGAAATQVPTVFDRGGHDLLVLGATLSESGGGVQLGELTARLLSESRCPVLVVRTGGPRP